MKTIHHAVLLALGIAMTPASAVSLSFEGAVQAALSGNRSLAAAGWEIEKARARLLQAGLLPNPEFEFAGMSDFIAGGDGEGAMSIALTQQFPITARLGLAREVRRVEVARALREIRNQKRLLIAQTQRAYAEIQAARLRERTALDAQKHALELLDLTKKRLASGQGSLAENGLLHVEERSWWTAAMEARTDAESRVLELKTLLGLSADAKLDLTDSLEAIETSMRKTCSRSATLQRPDVEMALLEIDRAGAEIRLARAEAWEGIKLGIEYTREHSVDEPEGLGTSQFLGIRVGIPLPVWDTKRGAVAERKAAEAQARAQVRALELEVANAIATAVRRVSLYDHQLRAYRADTRGIISASEQELARGFAEGRVDLRDLLQVRTQSASLKQGAISTLEKAVLSLIEWSAAAGSHPALSRPYVETESKPSQKKS